MQSVNRYENISAQEQLAIELINAARLDPVAEALRQGTNPQDVPQGSRGVLAIDELLQRAADGHTDWMIETETFSHTGANGSTPGDRIAAVSYGAPASVGENLAWMPDTSSHDAQDQVEAIHANLWNSSGHQAVMLNDAYRDIGIGQNDGLRSGVTGDLQTTNYGYLFSDATPWHLTGVAFDDHDGDLRYDIGEGREGVRFITSTQTGETAEAGGYSVGLGQGIGPFDVSIVVGDASMEARVSMPSDIASNIKLDLINGTTLASSGSLELGQGASHALLLGTQDLSLVGNDSANVLIGNSGNNIISGGDGNDAITGGAGDDTLSGGSGADILLGGEGDDVLLGDDGNDVIFTGAGIDFADGGSGFNVLIAGAGENLLQGGNEGNIFISGAGESSMSGGDGDDLFHISGEARTVIYTFDADSDILDFGNRFGSPEDILAGAIVRNASAGYPGDLVITHPGGIETILMGNGNLLSDLGENILDGQDDLTRAEALAPWINQLTPEQAGIVAQATLSDPENPTGSPLFGSSPEAITDAFEAEIAEAVNGRLFGDTHDDGEGGDDDGGSDTGGGDEGGGDEDPGEEEPQTSSSDGSCFVATASYGNAAHPDVIWLRTWRDEVLVTHPVGRALIAIYWKVGPALAGRVAKSPRMAMASRKILSSLVARLRG